MEIGYFIGTTYTLYSDFYYLYCEKQIHGFEKKMLSINYLLSRSGD